MKKNFFVKPIKPIIIGKIGSTYGISGWIKLFSLTEQPKNIFNYKPWFIKNKKKWKIINICKWKYYKNKFIIKINDINSKESANIFINVKIFVDSNQFPKLNNNQFYWKDILGCQVVNINGIKLGKVIDLIETGANDVIIIESNFKKNIYNKKFLIPFVNKKFIKNVNLIENIIEVDWN